MYEEYSHNSGEYVSQETMGNHCSLSKSRSNQRKINDIPKFNPYSNQRSMEEITITSEKITFLLDLFF